MTNKFYKQLSGDLVITISVPINYTVEAIDEEYEDKYGNKYFEEDYEIEVDQVLEQFPQHKSVINNLEHQGYKIEEIRIE